MVIYDIAYISMLISVYSIVGRVVISSGHRHGGETRIYARLRPSVTRNRSRFLSVRRRIPYMLDADPEANGCRPFLRSCVRAKFRLSVNRDDRSAITDLDSTLLDNRLFYLGIYFDLLHLKFICKKQTKLR